MWIKLHHLKQKEKPQRMLRLFFVHFFRINLSIYMFTHSVLFLSLISEIRILIKFFTFIVFRHKSASDKMIIATIVLFYLKIFEYNMMKNSLIFNSPDSIVF